MSILAVLYAETPLPLPASLEEAGASWGPLVDVSERGGHVVVEIELPGTEPGAVRVVCEAGALLVEGVKGHATCAEPVGSVQRFLRAERETGPFRRLVRLPRPVDARGGRARLRNGVLTVTLPPAVPAG